MCCFGGRVGAALTYRPDQASGFTSTGILSTVQANSGLLADVEARSKEVAPYLTNLVALTNALQQRYRPDPGDTTVALRLLLISDVHGGNQYPLAEELITAEQVGKEKNLDLILEVSQGTVLYAKPGTDITDEVVKRYNAAHPVKK